MSLASFRSLSRWVRQSLMGSQKSRVPHRRLPLRVQSLEDRTVPASIVGLEAAGLSLVKFDSATPGTTTTTAVSGLGADEHLVGIDCSPFNGNLIGLTIDSSADGRLYRIDPTTGNANFIAKLTASPTDKSNPYAFLLGSTFGMDFDPQTNVLRIVSDAGENLQAELSTGNITTDDDIDGDTFGLTGLAYNNNFKNAPSTQLFAINGLDDQLYTIASPSGGKTTKSTVQLGVNGDGEVGFDILGTSAFATLNVSSASSLYSINLTTGSAILVGKIGGGNVDLSDMAIILDITPPTVTSITLIDASPTSAKTVSFKVQFSENVNNVNSASYSVAESGTITGSKISTINYNPSNQSAIITVDSFTGVGGVGLNVVDTDLITDDFGLPLGGAGNGNGDKTGPEYLIQSALTVVISQPGTQSDPTNQQPIHFTVTFSEKVDGFDIADIVVGGATGATVTSVTSSDSIVFDVVVSGATTNGTITIDFPAGAAQDAATSKIDSSAPTGDNSVTLTGNLAPTITAPGGVLHVGEDADFTFSGANLISLSDPDAGTADIQLKITAANGIFTLATTSNITITAGSNGSGSMTIKGSQANINNAISGAKFRGISNFNGATTLQLDADDLGNTGTGGNGTSSKTVSITVDAVNDAPTITTPTSLNVDRNSTFSFTGSSSVSITDPDAGSGTMKVTLGVSHGTLTLGTKSGLSITVGDGTDDAAMTFTGTLANINSALASLQYKPTTDYLGADTFAITADDQGNSGTGTTPVASANSAITVNVPGNRAPVAVNDTFNITQNQTLTITAPGLVQNDTDADNNLLSADLITSVDPSKGTLDWVGNGAFTFTPKPNFHGVVTFTYKASDGPSQSNTATVTINVAEQFTRLSAAGADAGGGPHVMVFNEDGSVRFSFYAYDPGFTGGVSVATGDVNGDGVEDIIVGAGAGGGPHVRVLSGVDLSPIMDFMAFSTTFSGGVNVAAGDVNGDGIADIVVGAGAGAASHVRVFDGSTGGVIQEFRAFTDLFRGGVYVAAGDLDGDGKADIVAGAGAAPGGSPHVIAFKGMSSEIMQSFLAFDRGFDGGVRVAVGKFAGKNAIFTAAGPSGVPVINIFDYATQKSASSFFAFGEGETTGDNAIKGGTHISTEVKSDGSTLLYIGAGRDHGPTFRVLDATNLAEKSTFSAFDPSFLGGVFVG